MTDTTTTTATPKTRTITLTDRPPVTIREVEWPIIAIGDYRPGALRNGTPVPDSETDRYTIRVRERGAMLLVYGVIDAATAWTGTEDWRGGEIIAGDDRHAHVVAAIKRVGAGMPDRVVQACIADLPAEAL